MTWKHYPDSPFGDVDICEHGCCRPHGNELHRCVICDHPGEVHLAACAVCSGGGRTIEVQTWHDEQGNCLRCEFLRMAEKMTFYTRTLPKCQCGKPIEVEIFRTGNISYGKFCWACAKDKIRRLEEIEDQMTLEGRKCSPESQGST